MSISRDHIEKRQNYAQMGHIKAKEFAINFAKQIMYIPSPELHIVDGPIKELDRIFEKAAGKCSGNLDEVNDIGRLRILFNDPEQFIEVRNLFDSGQKLSKFCDELASHGIEIKEFEDNFLNPKPHGFIGANLTIKMDLNKGRSECFEIQFMHEKMQLTDKLTHATYEEHRSIEDNAKAENRDLTNQEQQIILGYKIASANIYRSDAHNYDLIQLLDNPNAHDEIINKMQEKFDKLQIIDQTPPHQFVYAPDPE